MPATHLLCLLPVLPPPAEAVKHKRDSWQTWENYAQVAVRVRQWQTAVRALQQVLVLSSGQRADLTLVAALVGQVEVVRGVGGSGSEAADGEAELPLTSAASNGGDAAAGAERAMPADAQAAAGAAAAVDSGSGSMAELAAALGELSGGGGSAASRGGGGAGDAVQKAEARGQGVLEQSVGTLMKQVRHAGHLDGVPAVGAPAISCNTARRLAGPALPSGWLPVHSVQLAAYSPGVLPTAAARGT